MRRDTLLAVALVALSVLANAVIENLRPGSAPFIRAILPGLLPAPPSRVARPVPAPAPMPARAAQVAPPRGSRPLAAGMTWTVTSLARDGPATSAVGCEGGATLGSATSRCNPYEGDTSCVRSLPLLCLNKNGAPAPRGDDGMAAPAFHRWSGARLALSPAVAGHALTSASSADQICAERLGSDWRMAEFHDGGGWGLRGLGTIATGTRFWVRINDQPANCWDPVAPPTGLAPTIAGSAADLSRARAAASRSASVSAASPPR